MLSAFATRELREGECHALTTGLRVTKNNVDGAFAIALDENNVDRG